MNDHSGTGRIVSLSLIRMLKSYPPVPQNGGISYLEIRPLKMGISFSVLSTVGWL